MIHTLSSINHIHNFMTGASFLLPPPPPRKFKERGGRGVGGGGVGEGQGEGVGEGLKRMEVLAYGHLLSELLMRLSVERVFDVSGISPSLGASVDANTPSGTTISMDGDSMIREPFIVLEKQVEYVKNNQTASPPGSADTTISAEEKKRVELLHRIAAQCVLPTPSQRPSMSRVARQLALAFSF